MAHPKYDLAELVARIPKDYKAAELDFGPPVGKEAWQSPHYVLLSAAPDNLIDSRQQVHRKKATMHNAHLPVQETDRRGQSLYDEKLRRTVETPDNIGKQIVIDVETGDYEIDDDGLAASRRLLAKRPDAPLYGLRVGYNAVYTLGEMLEPTGSA